MNKAELIDALADRLGDRKTAMSALDAVLAEVQAAVAKGDRVAITGFGVFEKRVRGPRTARNPRTGETVKVKKTSVPTFKPGTGFKEMVASGRVPKAAGPGRKAAAKKAPATKAAAKKAPATKAAAKKAPATKAAARKTTAKKAPAAPRKTAGAAKKTAGAAKKTAAKKATAKKAPAAARKTTGAAKKTPARKTTARR